MIIDFDTVIRDLDDKPLKEVDRDELGRPKEGTERDMTLKTVSVNALMAQYADEERLAGSVKLERFLIATKINGGGKVELSTKESSSILSLIEKAYGVLVVGRATPILNGK